MLASALLATTLVRGPQELTEAWDKATRIITQGFYAKATRGEEMKKIFAKWEPKAKSAANREEFGKVMNAMIDDFQDSHFAFLGNDSQGYYLFDGLSKIFAKKDGEPMPHIGAWFRATPTGQQVQMLLEGGPAAKAGLRKGDIVVSADGTAFHPINSLKDKSEVALTYVRKGKNTQVKVAPLVQPGIKMFLDATNRSARVIESGGKKYGYIHLWTQGGEDFVNAVHSAVARFQSTDGFILDLRDGFGGRPERYADPFFRPEVVLDWTIQGVQQKQYYGYGRPLVVIINEGSRSAKEVLSFILKKSKRATLVGHNTAGAVLGTTPLRLNEWAFLEVPIATVTADGVNLEDKGVAPDVYVKDEFDDAGTDLMLKKAVEVLSKK